MIRCAWKWGMHPIICHFIIFHPWRDSSSTTNHLMGRPLTTRMWWNPPQKLESWKIQKDIGYCGMFVESWTMFCIFVAASLWRHSPPPSPSFRDFVAAKQCLQQRCHASGRTSHPDLTSGAHGIGFTELPRCSQQLDMANLSFGECGIGIATITICQKNHLTWGKPLLKQTLKLGWFDDLLVCDNPAEVQSCTITRVNNS